MRIAVFGTGGIGGYFGGRLAQAGQDVIFIARGKHLDALQAKGLRVDSIAGDFVISPVKATNTPEEIGAVDVVLVCVKTWQVAEAAEAMRPFVGPDTMVVPLQNGIDAPAQLADVLGTDHVIGGLCRIISFVAGPGHIQHAGGSPAIEFGELDNRMSERVEKLRLAFDAADGVTAIIPNDIQIAMWQKFLLIVSWSGLGAITRAPIGTIRGLPETHQLLRGVMQEVFNVAQAHNIALDESIIEKTLNFMDKIPAAGTASMQRDIMDGRPSELEAQNGAVVRLGQAAGVETPLNRFIYRSLLPLEKKARGELEFTI